MNRLHKEFKDIQNDPPHNTKWTKNDNLFECSCFNWPRRYTYNGGVFILDIFIPVIIQ